MNKKNNPRTFSLVIIKKILQDYLNITQTMEQSLTLKNMNTFYSCLHKRDSLLQLLFHDSSVDTQLPDDQKKIIELIGHYDNLIYQHCLKEKEDLKFQITSLNRVKSKLLSYEKMSSSP
jgi:hypothetical protein